MPTPDGSLTIEDIRDVAAFMDREEAAQARRAMELGVDTDWLVMAEYLARRKLVAKDVEAGGVRLNERAFYRIDGFMEWRVPPMILPTSGV